MKSNKYPAGKIIVKIIGVCSYLERHWNPNQIEIYEPSDVCLGQHIASVVVAAAVSLNFRTLFSISYCDHGLSSGLFHALDQAQQKQH